MDDVYEWNKPLAFQTNDLEECIVTTSLDFGFESTYED